MKTLLIWLSSAVMSWAVKLTITSGMTLSDFYEQGFYPEHYSKDAVIFYVNSLEVHSEEGEKIVVLSGCRAILRFTIRGEFKYGAIYENSPTTPESAISKLEWMSQAVDRKINYSVFPPQEGPASDPLAWTAGSVDYKAADKAADSEWEFTLAARRDLESVYTTLHLGQKFSRLERRKMSDERINTDLPIKEPVEWSDLPLNNYDRGHDPQVRNFTYLISSYDEQGKLKPEFAQLKREIESAPPLDGIPGAREKATVSSPPKTTPNTWIIASVALLLLASGYAYYRKRHCK